MGIEVEILKHYYCLEQPDNSMWLEGVINAESMLIDKMELIAAKVMWDAIQHVDHTGYQFEFSNSLCYNDEPVIMLPLSGEVSDAVYSIKDNIDLMYIKTNEFSSSSLKLMCATDCVERDHLYISLCALYFNQNINKRPQFRRLCFVHNPNGFCDYVHCLREFLEKHHVINNEILKGHFKLIADCLNMFANGVGELRQDLNETLRKLLENDHFLKSHNIDIISQRNLYKLMKECINMRLDTITQQKFPLVLYDFVGVAEDSLLMALDYLLDTSKKYSTSVRQTIAECYQPLKTIADRQFMSTNEDVKQILDKFKQECSHPVLSADK
ncbi:MAG: hypothetical protein K2H01_11025 [Ruminococcus sp.]|nr:hypothetical protein [Ruminococcus sp.]